MNKRAHDRLAHQLRPIKITGNIAPYAAGSVLFELGNTKVLCAVTLQNGVPIFLRGKKVGWLNAEYAMLPIATPVRTPREITHMKRAGRSVEISRLIGRTLRTVVDLSTIGESTLVVDCDVLQADGGTRVAAITGSYLALLLAQQRWLQEGIIAEQFLKDSTIALSVGMLKNKVMIVDPDYLEDTQLDADFNFIMTGSGRLIEIHGGAERSPLPWDCFMSMQQMAMQAAKELVTTVQQTVAMWQEQEQTVAQRDTVNQQDSTFSLKNRLNYSHDSV